MSEQFKTYLLCNTSSLKLQQRSAHDTHKFKPAVIEELTQYLNDHVVAGGLKKKGGVAKKIKDLLAIFAAVEYLRTRSGGHWDDEHGANMTTPEELQVWKSIVATKKEYKPKGDHRYSAISGTTGIIISGQPSSSSAPLASNAIPDPLPLPPATTTSDNDPTVASSPGDHASVLQQDGSPDWDELQMNQDIAVSRSTSQPPVESAQEITASASTSQPEVEPTAATETPACKPISQKCSADSSVFNSVFGALLAHLEPKVDPSPVCRSKAMAIAADKEESWLSLCNQMKLGGHLESTVKADAYLVYADHGSPKRKAWVATQLELPEEELPFDMLI
uniref:Myb/SANT-like domain-containing protein n=1 Tax=Moniliophthora roreri TaxID=221103 RepID=A0A0W0FIX4_MONRR